MKIKFDNLRSPALVALLAALTLGGFAPRAVSAPGDPIDLSSDAADWSAVPYADLGSADPEGDTQANNDELDIVGTNAPSFHAPAYYKISTSSGTDGYMAFRARMKKDKNGDGEFTSGVVWFGIDANEDDSMDPTPNDIELFVGISGKQNFGQSQIVIQFTDGGSANISPSTTGTVTTDEYTKQAVEDTNWKFEAVNSTNDSTASNFEIGLIPDMTPDNYFLSAQLPFSQLVSMMNSLPEVTGFNADTPFRFIVLTAQQLNSFNSDLVGIGDYDNNTSFADLGVFSEPVTADGSPPVNTAPSSLAAGSGVQTAVLPAIEVTDFDGNLSTVQVAVDNGTLFVDLAGGATISAGANNSGSLTLSGSQEQINLALASLQYTSDGMFSGPDTLTLTSTDTGSLTDVDTLTINVSATGTPTLIAASGGTTMPNCSATDAENTWTSLSGPSYEEGATANIGTGTIILDAPSGFRFNPAGSVNVTVAKLSGSTGANVNGLADAAVISASIAGDGSSITVTITSSTSGDTKNRLTWSGIQVQPLMKALPFASGSITHSGTAVLNGVTGSASFGDLNVVSSAVNAYQLSVATDPIAAGGTSELTLTAVTACGTLVESYSGDKTVNLSGLGPSPNAPGDPTFTDKNGAPVNFGSNATVSFVNGVATTTITGYKAETGTLQASSGSVDSSNTGGVSDTLTVGPAAPDSLAIQSQPSPTATVSQPFAQQPVVCVVDQYGNVVTSSNAAITVTDTGAGDLGGVTTLNANMGCASFAGLSHDTEETIQLQFNSTGLNQATSATILLTASSVKDWASGDVVITDRGMYEGTGSVLFVDKSNGNIQEIILTSVRDPYEVTLDSAGNIWLVDHTHDHNTGVGGKVYKVDRVTKVTTEVASGTGVNGLFTPVGVKIDNATGKVIVADADAFLEGAIFRIDEAPPYTMETVSQGGHFDFIQGLDLDHMGSAYVSVVGDVTGVPKLVKVNLSDGMQTVVSQQGMFNYPVGVKYVSDTAVYVVDAFAQALLQVDATNGSQTVIHQGHPFDVPTFIDRDLNGDWLVTDAKNEYISGNGQRILHRVSSGSGVSTLTSDGYFETPRGVAVVP